MPQSFSFPFLFSKWVFEMAVILYLFTAVNACYLGKNGLVTYLFKIFSLYQRKHLILLKHAIDTLALLVKSSKFSTRITVFYSIVITAINLH